MSLPERAEQRRAVVGTRKPRVAVIGTGGTISGGGRHSLDLSEYMDYGRRQEAAALSARWRCWTTDMDHAEKEERFARAVDASLDRLATVVKNPGRLSELLFGKA